MLVVLMRLIHFQLENINLNDGFNHPLDKK